MPHRSRPLPPKTGKCRPELWVVSAVAGASVRLSGVTGVAGFAAAHQTGHNAILRELEEV